jgi:hypothetical protein
MALYLTARRLWNTPCLQEQDSIGLQAMVASYSLADVADDNIHITWLWVCRIKAGLGMHLPSFRGARPGWLVTTLNFTNHH